MKARRFKEKDKTKSKKNKVLIIVCIVLLIAIGVSSYICYCNSIETSSIIFQKYSLKQDTPDSMSEELLKERNFEGMKIKDISIKKEDGIVYFFANIENNTDKNFEGKNVKIKFVDKENKPIANFNTKIESIVSKEAVSMQISTSMDLTRSFNFVIE